EVKSGPLGAQIAPELRDSFGPLVAQVVSSVAVLRHPARRVHALERCLGIGLLHGGIGPHRPVYRLYRPALAGRQGGIYSLAVRSDHDHLHTLAIDSLAAHGCAPVRGGRPGTRPLPLPSP